MDDLINNLELDVSNLIRKRLGNSDIDFIGGNTLDGLIKDHIDIKYVCMRAEVLYNNALAEHGKKTNEKWGNV